MFLKLTTYCIFYFCFLPIPLEAQNFKVTVSSDSVLIGNYVEISFIAENTEGQFEAPSFEGCEILGGPNRSSSVQIVNGDKTSKITYSYFVRPTELGTVVIEPAYLLDSKIGNLESLPLEIHVYPNPENIITEPERKHPMSIFDFRLDNNLGTTPNAPIKPQPTKRKYKKI